MISNKNIVIREMPEVAQRSITINLDGKKLSKLNYMLNNLKITHLPGYWTLQELLKDNNNKDELVYAQISIKSCIPVLEHIKHQISRFYIFDAIESKILQNKSETELSKLLSDFINIMANKNDDKNNVLTEEIISKLLISNINTIFNKHSDKKLKNYYDIRLVPSFDSECKNKDYFNEAIDYVSNYGVDQISVSVEPKIVNKKIHKI